MEWRGVRHETIPKSGGATQRPLRQAAALPWRPAPGGGVRTLLITSRGTGRWLAPKGKRIKGLGWAESAAREAFEEAGLIGRVDPESCGRYAFVKNLPDGGARPCVVSVFRLEVVAELDDWPERDQRERRWFDPRDAAELVAEPDLRRLILQLC